MKVYLFAFAICIRFTVTFIKIGAKLLLTKTTKKSINPVTDPTKNGVSALTYQAHGVEYLKIVFPWIWWNILPYKNLVQIRSKCQKCQSLIGPELHRNILNT